MSKLIAAAILAAATATTAGANTMAARTTTDTVVTAHAGFRTEVVRTDDLNLASAAGRAALDRRVARAADRVCTVTTLRDAWEQRLAARCRDDVLARVQPQVAEAIGG